MKVWAILAVCIVGEVTATSLLKKSEGFTNLPYGLTSIAIFALCFWGVSYVLTRLPIGVTYAIWAGMGICLVTLVGWSVFRQPLTLPQLVFIAMIICGAVGLSLVTSPTT
jgi:small multidrug resistance pump